MRGYNNKNIVLHELVGLDAKVVNSSDMSQIGIKGKVIRETKNLLFLDDNNRTRMIVKKNSTFEFSKGKEVFVVKGEEINFRPYERTEKALKFYKKRKLIQ
jgi:ribonuclease P protein subunit POP4